ncbi:GPP34 family phosphoprotein [Nonomuraea sp. NPDC052116]|uniref:GOLPH3/VPS74 family protein n=1 Tax=Nonomuraea sp. NPDC052116 TaxID=3155665 RepID=UPI003422103F
MLIVEDLMLLMLDDETGAIAGAGTLHYSLGGAVLVELALDGRIETDGGRPGLNGPKVIAAGDGPLSDPLLQSAYEKVAERPQRVQPLLLAIGGGRAVLVDGESPDARTAAVIALLSSSGTLPALRTPLAWSAKVRERAKELENGSWGAAAVNTAVTRTAAAIAASSAAVSVAVITAVT